MAKNKEGVLIFRLPKDLRDKVVRLAKKSNESISEFLRGIVERL